MHCDDLSILVPTFKVDQVNIVGSSVEQDQWLVHPQQDFTGIADIELEGQMQGDDGKPCEDKIYVYGPIDIYCIVNDKEKEIEKYNWVKMVTVMKRSYVHVILCTYTNMFFFCFLPKKYKHIQNHSNQKQK